MTNRRIQIIILLLAACWIGLTAAFVNTSDEGWLAVPREGFFAPDFTLEDLDGNQINLSQFRGQPVILNLWASWCKPCQAEMPALENVYQKLNDQGLVILAVNITSQDQELNVREFLVNSMLTFTVLLDREGEVEELYWVKAFPTTYFIDQEGVIRSVVIGGPMPESLISSNVSKLLEGK